MMSQTKKSIQIDANPMIMNECLEAYAMGNEKEGRRILKAFLKEVEESGQDHCSCGEPCASRKLQSMHPFAQGGYGSCTGLPAGRGQ